MAGEMIKLMCDLYMESDDYKNGIYKDDKYQKCCVALDYCSFYWRGWFWGLMGGLIFLLIVASIVGSFFCCCRRRGGGGLDGNGHDNDASEPSDSTKSSMKNP